MTRKTGMIRMAGMIWIIDDWNDYQEDLLDWGDTDDWEE